MTISKLSISFASVACAFALFACNAPVEEPASPDAEDASFGAIGGKADSTALACQETALLGWINNAGEGNLKAAGVHTRAANAINKFRAGDDGALGTGDDQAIGSLEELDAIRYVGPVALEQLTAGALADDACSERPSIDVIFSPQPSESSHSRRVAELISNAEHSVDIAIYSFRDSNIQNELADALERGVKVRVIFESANKDRRDPEGTVSAKLEEMGIDVRYVNKIMHHKFAIIDGPREFTSRARGATIASGSANWSSSAATRYDENTVFVTGSAELAMRFQREFNYLWSNSRDFVFGEPKPWVLSELEITDDMIPSEPDIGAVFTSANFKTFNSASHGPGFSRVRGRDEISDFIVAQIEAADTSIRVASGHLRSRPIAEALIAKHQDDPNIDIQVYLDGQEYISSFWSNKQQDELDDCLVEAGDSESKQQDCIDKGFYFGLALHEAGIDVRYKYYSYRWHYRTAPQMHHKYLIIDSDTVIQGSYNLSDNAEHNTMENMAIFTGADAKGLVDAYNANFDTMWVTGDGLFTGLIDEIETSTDTIPIIFDAMSLDWDQVTQLKGLIRSTCPAINSDEYRENPDKKFVCEL